MHKTSSLVNMSEHDNPLSVGGNNNNNILSGTSNNGVNLGLYVVKNGHNNNNTI